MRQHTTSYWRATAARSALRSSPRKTQHRVEPPTSTATVSVSTGLICGHLNSPQKSSCVFWQTSLRSGYAPGIRHKVIDGIEWRYYSLYLHFKCDHHHHHHPRISSRRKSWTKLQGRCVSRITLMSMLLWPIVCVAVWSAEQFRFQCTLECPQWRQRSDRRRQRIPNLCRGNGEGAIADGPVQRPWNMQRLWTYTQTINSYITRRTCVVCEGPGLTPKIPQHLHFFPVNMCKNVLLGSLLCYKCGL